MTDYGSSDKRTRLKIYSDFKDICIGTAGAFSPDGKMLYYAMSPSWDEARKVRSGKPNMVGTFHSIEMCVRFFF
jgi:hypothetical protein